MTTLREAAQQALEALEDFRFAAGFDRPLAQDAIDALSATLAQQDEPVQEPVTLKRGLTGRCTRKVCECEKEGFGLECIYLEPMIDGYPLWSGIPKAETVQEPQTLDDAMHRAPAYECGYKAGQTHERERIIKFLQEMQRVVGDAHNHYGIAAVRIKEGV